MGITMRTRMTMRTMTRMKMKVTMIITLWQCYNHGKSNSWYNLKQQFTENATEKTHLSVFSLINLFTKFSRAEVKNVLSSMDFKIPTRV